MTKKKFTNMPPFTVCPYSDGVESDIPSSLKAQALQKVVTG